MSLDTPNMNNSKASTNSFSEGDYIAANMMVILKLLNKNSTEIKDMRSKIIDFLREHGFDADNDHVNTLSETLGGVVSSLIF